MVEVYKTNVNCPQSASTILLVLKATYPLASINFDLEDCDRILRVEYPLDLSGIIPGILKIHGFQCEVLES